MIFYICKNNVDKFLTNTNYKKIDLDVLLKEKKNQKNTFSEMHQLLDIIHELKDIIIKHQITEKDMNDLILQISPKISLDISIIYVGKYNSLIDDIEKTNSDKQFVVLNHIFNNLQILKIVHLDYLNKLDITEDSFNLHILNNYSLFIINKDIKGFLKHLQESLNQLKQLDNTEIDEISEFTLLISLNLIFRLEITTLLIHKIYYACTRDEFHKYNEIFLKFFDGLLDRQLLLKKYDINNEKIAKCLRYLFDKFQLINTNLQGLLQKANSNDNGNNSLHQLLLKLTKKDKLILKHLTLQPLFNMVFDYLIEIH
jgi:hypothetical protein